MSYDEFHKKQIELITELEDLAKQCKMSLWSEKVQELIDLQDSYLDECKKK